MKFLFILFYKFLWYLMIRCIPDVLQFSVGYFKRLVYNDMKLFTYCTFKCFFIKAILWHFKKYNPQSSLAGKFSKCSIWYFSSINYQVCPLQMFSFCKTWKTFYFIEYYFLKFKWEMIYKMYILPKWKLQRLDDQKWEKELRSMSINQQEIKIILDFLISSTNIWHTLILHNYFPFYKNV